MKIFMCLGFEKMQENSRIELVGSQKNKSSLEPAIAELAEMKKMSTLMKFENSFYAIMNSMELSQFQLYQNFNYVFLIILY